MIVILLYPKLSPPQDRSTHSPICFEHWQLIGLAAKDPPNSFLLLLISGEEIHDYASFLEGNSFQWSVVLGKKRLAPLPQFERTL